MGAINRVALIGLGAVGVLYATQLQKVLGDKLCIVADAKRIARYKEEGVYANGKLCSFNFVAADELKPQDLLIFSTKATGLADAIELVRGACGPDTIVISFLNGVSSEAQIEEALSPNHLLYATVQGMDATRIENDVRFTQGGWVAFGEKDGSKSPAVKAVAELFDAAQIRYDIPEDIIHQQWSKWMLNVGVNQACGYYGVSYAGVQKPGEARDAMICAMNEARSVAAVEGIELSAAERDEWVRVVDELSPEGEPSMRQDMRTGRPTEVALFSAVVRELGQKHGIATPQNDLFYTFFTQPGEGA